MFLAELADKCPWISVETDGEFDTLGNVEDAGRNKKLLVYIEDEKYVDMAFENKNVGCIICREEMLKHFATGERFGLCTAGNPKRAFFEIHNYLAGIPSFYEQITTGRISASSRIHPSAVVAGRVIIGDGTIIEPNVTIYDNVEIGSNVIVGAGSVIGGEGFKFFRDGDVVISVKHAGKVVIGDNVEIQSNCCIDKAIFEEATIIGEYTKLDNFVHVAHNVKIGKRCLVAANAVISGYTEIGDDVWIGPSSTISNFISVGNRARITIGSVITKNVKEGEVVYLPRYQVNMPGDLNAVMKDAMKRDDKG
ncbi:MAG: UDP-3-O-(3-hydroxymyristoyl)glucosamine N-acyltransferase [Acetivibrionales bacterium]|jgi:acyl-[acyl carrier protein]--UDP-N-acetylglucosamine O-acyltransferase